MDTGSKISFPFHDYIFDRIIRIPADDNNYSLVIFRAEAISDIRIAREFTHTYVEKALVPQNTL